MSYGFRANRNVLDLLGKTLKSVDKRGDDEIHFCTTEGDHYIMRHDQDCCEHVYIEDVCGDLEDLVGSPLVIAEEVTNYEGEAVRGSESYTWTFYKFATTKGYVTIRWFGESNGYYSERVDFIKV